MNLKLIFIFLFFVLFVTGCQPDITDRLALVEKCFDEQELAAFKNEAEDDALYGIWAEKSVLIIDGVLKKEEGAFITQYFNDKGIQNYEDMAYVLLISLHRDLNNEIPGTEADILYVKKDWQEIYNCYKIKAKRVLDIIQEYKIGDTIRITYPYDAINNTAVYYDCPTSISPAEEGKTVIVKGVVLHKFTSKVTTRLQYFYRVKILGLSAYPIKILSQPIHPGDSIEVSLEEVEISNITLDKPLR